MSGYIVNSSGATLHLATPDDGLMAAAGNTAPSQGQLSVGPTASGVPRLHNSGPIVLGATKAIRHAQSGGGGTSHAFDVLGVYEYA